MAVPSNTNVRAAVGRSLVSNGICKFCRIQLYPSSPNPIARQNSFLVFVRLQNATNGNLDVVTNFNEICYFVSDNSVLCYFISIIMANALQISDTAYESRWYLMTAEDQVIIEMVIRRAQRPFEIKGLGVLVCSLETLLRVSATAKEIPF